MNREQNIKFLKQIDAGLISLESLKEQSAVVIYNCKNVIDNTLLSEKTNQEINSATRGYDLDYSKLSTEALSEIMEVNKKYINEGRTYRIASSTKLLTKEEVDTYTQDMHAIAFLPDNGRDPDLRR